jgi:hypothetical protein
MRLRFFRGATSLAASVAVTAVLALFSVSPAQASAKPDATPSCGSSCANVFSERYGFSLFQTSWRHGSKLAMLPGSNTNTGQDFVITDVASVSTLCAAYPAQGSLNPNSYACLAYGAFPWFQVYEANYSPAGTPTSKCAGLASAAYAGEAVTLQTCGTPRTEWIVDFSNSTLFFYGFYLTPFVNASDTSSSHPEVLTVSSSPRSPRHPLVVKPEQKFSDGTVADNQEFGIVWGPL